MIKKGNISRKLRGTCRFKLSLAVFSLNSDIDLSVCSDWLFTLAILTFTWTKRTPANETIRAATKK